MYVAHHVEHKVWDAKLSATWFQLTLGYPSTLPQWMDFEQYVCAAVHSEWYPDMYTVVAQFVDFIRLWILFLQQKIRKLKMQFCSVQKQVKIDTNRYKISRNKLKSLRTAMKW